MSPRVRSNRDRTARSKQLGSTTAFTSKFGVIMATSSGEQTRRLGTFLRSAVGAVVGAIAGVFAAPHVLAPFDEAPFWVAPAIIIGAVAIGLAAFMLIPQYLRGRKA